MRICDNCKQKKNKLTGKRVVSKDRLTYKWICRTCAENN